MGGVEFGEHALEMDVESIGFFRVFGSAGLSFEESYSEFRFEVANQDTDARLCTSQPLGSAVDASLFVGGHERSDVFQVHSTKAIQDFSHRLITRCASWKPERSRVRRGHATVFGTIRLRVLPCSALM